MGRVRAATAVGAEARGLWRVCGMGAAGRARERSERLLREGRQVEVEGDGEADGDGPRGWAA